MSAAHEIPVEVADELFSLECRVTFFADSLLRRR